MIDLFRSLSVRTVRDIKSLVRGLARNVTFSNCLIKFLDATLQPAKSRIQSCLYGTYVFIRECNQRQFKILAALGFYASGSYQKMLGANFNLGLGQTSVSYCLTEVTEALNIREVLLYYITFPKNASERQAVIRRFYDEHGFPGVIGCIEGTHVAIKRPADSEHAYFNEKHYHSLNCLIVCDANLQILHVDASFGGATDNSHIWNCSTLFMHMQNILSQERCWLLGNSSYEQRPNLMTPIQDAVPESPEDNYNRQLRSTRKTVQRCIYALKARWQCLLAHRAMHYDPIKAAKMVNACVVLHNMCNRARLPVPELDDDARRRESKRQIHRNANTQDADPTGRDQLVQLLWTARS